MATKPSKLIGWVKEIDQFQLFLHKGRYRLYRNGVAGNLPFQEDYRSEASAKRAAFVMVGQVVDWRPEGQHFSRVLFAPKEDRV